MVLDVDARTPPFVVRPACVTAGRPATAADSRAVIGRPAGGSLSLDPPVIFCDLRMIKSC
jgi:hypothetical protein